MTPQQLHMITIKSMIEQIVESYLTTLPEEEAKNGIAHVLNSFKISGKLASYGVTLSPSKDKLTVLFSTPTGDGCELSFLVSKYKTNTYRPLQDLVNLQFDKHVIGDVLSNIKGKSIIPNTELISHTNANVSPSLQALAIWHAAFTDKQNVVYVVPMLVNKDKCIQDLHSVCVKNSIYVTTVDTHNHVMTFNNNSTITVISLTELYTNNSRFSARTAQLVIGDLQLNNLVSSELYSQLYLSFCYIIESINSPQRNYNNSLVLACDNWAIHNFAVANSAVKETYLVGMSATGAILHNIGVRA